MKLRFVLGVALIVVAFAVGHQVGRTQNAKTIANCKHLLAKEKSKECLFCHIVTENIRKIT